MLLGGLLLINDADIFIGFLWVIDLGVGLIFFIFIIHFTAFLYQKSEFNLSARYFYFIIVFYITIIFIYYYMPSGIDLTFYNDLNKT